MEVRTHGGASAPAAIDARPSAPSADPWDAPYFGAPVYLGYQPSLPPIPEPVTMSAATANAAAVADPIAWPFFGAPIYAGFPAFEAQESSAAALAVASVTAPPQSTSDPWDAPYFGAPVYLGYFPTPGIEMATPAPVAARPAAAAPETEFTAKDAKDAKEGGLSSVSSAVNAPQPCRRSWFSALFNWRRRA